MYWSRIVKLKEKVSEKVNTDVKCKNRKIIYGEYLSKCAKSLSTSESFCHMVSYEIIYQQRVFTDCTHPHSGVFHLPAPPVKLSRSYLDDAELLGLFDSLEEETSDPITSRGAYLSLIYLRHLKLRELQVRCTAAHYFAEICSRSCVMRVACRCRHLIIFSQGYILKYSFFSF